MQRRPEFARIRTCLAGSVHFSALSSADLDGIAELGHLARLTDGQSLHQPGDPVSSFWIVLSGSLRITSSEEDGGEFVYVLLGAGSFFGLGYVLGDAPLGVSASAYGATELAAIGAERFTALCDNTPGLWRHVTKLMTRRLSVAMIAMRDISNAPLSRRILRRLAGQAVSRGADLVSDARIELRVTQSDLAAMLGASRSKVNAELKQLAADGLIEVGYRVIVLRDLPRLRALAGGDVFAY